MTYKTTIIVAALVVAILSTSSAYALSDWRTACGVKNPIDNLECAVDHLEGELNAVFISIADHESRIVSFESITIVNGTDGIDGAPGPEGPTGPAGIQGESGIQGIQGIPGTDGINGTDGTQGPIGQQGESGIDGIQGPQGLQGETGPQGPAGTIDPGFEARLLALEDFHFPTFLRVDIDPNFPGTFGTFWQINEPLLIDGWTAIEGRQGLTSIDRSDEIVITIKSPNGSEIYNGPQPVTLIPDRNGLYQVIGTLEGRQAAASLLVDGDTFNLTIDTNIVDIDGRDFIEITTTGFYPGDPISAVSQALGNIGSGIVDENRVGIILSDHNLEQLGCVANICSGQVDTIFVFDHTVSDPPGSGNPLSVSESFTYP